MKTVAELKRAYYDARPGWRDGTRQYLDMLERYVRPDQVVLDVGAGDGRHFVHPLRGRVRELVGVDVDAGVLHNALVDRGVLAPVERLPLPEASCDLVVSSFTFEHLRDPAAALRELRRVLRPGGSVIFRTPNLWHYVTLGSRCTPHFVHRWLAARLRGLSAGHEPYATYYRLNTRRRARALFRRCGFLERELRLIEPEPSYLMFSPIAFRAGFLYERLVNCGGLLAEFRVTLMGVFERGDG